MVRVKICGITSLQEVKLCVEEGADALGFIFAQASPRCLSIEVAEQLTRAVPPYVTTVGVFAGNSTDQIAQALRRCRLDLLQFSGAEAPSFMGAFDRPTIVVVHVQRDIPLDAALTIALPDERALAVARANAVAIDSLDSSASGGTGIRVRDDIAAALCARSPLPFILSGGLTPDTVAASVARIQPWGVDVRSGVEQHGKKDPQLVERFVRAVKSVRHDGRFAQALGGI